MVHSVSPAIGVGPTSVSQHAGSKTPFMKRRQQQEKPFSSSSGVCRPASSMPSGQIAVSRRTPRPASAALLRQNTSSEVASLSQQLHDVQQQQLCLEKQRQQQRAQYRRQLRTLCDDNATLRNIIQAGERRRREEKVAAAAGLVTSTGTRVQTSSASSEPATVTEAEVEALSQRTHLARQRHNKVLHDIKMEEAAFDAAVKAHESLAEQTQITLDPAKLLMSANRTVYLRMMRLEQLINNVLSKQRVAGVVLANYRHHLGVLAAEATQYDAQQALLEKEFADRHRDHLKLLQLYDTARSAYTTAVETLQAVQKNASCTRKAKEKALQQKRGQVDKELVVTQQQERRTVDLQQQLEEETQMLEAEENMQAQLEHQRMNSRAALAVLRATGASPEGGTDGTGESLTGTDERVAAYEIAFRDMMRVAKVTTLDALVERYEAEIEQQYRLKGELASLREAQAALEENVQQLRELVKQTKYCAGTTTRLVTENTALGAVPAIVSTAPSHLMERELQTFVREEKASLAIHVGASEANQALLMEVVERVNHLAELVADYRADVRVPSIQYTAALAKRSSTLPLHVTVLAQKLLALAADTAGEADLRPSSPAEGTEQAGGVVQGDEGSRSAAAVVSSAQIVIPANNRRITLAHDGTGGDAGGLEPGARRRRTPADVVGISSSAAPMLLYLHEGGHGGREGGAFGALTNQRRRRSSASAGAGFIEGLQDDDDVPLATVAALPPPGGRVLDFDAASTDTSELHSGISGRSGTDDGGRGGDDGAGGDSKSAHRAAAVACGRGRLSRLPRHMATARTVNAHQANVQSIARAVEDDQEDPLRREEVKRMSELVRARQKLETVKNSRRR